MFNHVNNFSMRDETILQSDRLAIDFSANTTAVISTTGEGSPASSNETF